MKEPPISRDRRFGGFLYPDQAGGFLADGPEPSASGISEKVRFFCYSIVVQKFLKKFCENPLTVQIYLIHCNQFRNI
nr:MAG TPA: hypothetical protein [Caudoviricetes sp.]